MIGFYVPDTPIAAFARALHFIALAGVADALIGRRLERLKQRAQNAPINHHAMIAREYSEVLEAFNRATRDWWRIAMLWPRGYRLEHGESWPT